MKSFTSVNDFEIESNITLNFVLFSTFHTFDSTRCHYSENMVYLIKLDINDRKNETNPSSFQIGTRKTHQNYGMLA